MFQVCLILSYLSATLFIENPLMGKCVWAVFLINKQMSSYTDIFPQTHSKHSIGKYAHDCLFSVTVPNWV